MKDTPLVSVIIPCFNAAPYLQQAIDSALYQTYENIEVIVIDDGSKDNSLEILRTNYGNNTKVKILSHPDNANLGVSKTRKKGIEAASGEYIAYLDADDIFLPHKVEAQLHAFKQNPSVVLVHSCAKFITDAETDFYHEYRRFDKNIEYAYLEHEGLVKNKICNSSVMVKKQLVYQLQNSFNQLYQYEDWINWILISQYGKFYYINEPLCIYRFNADSATGNLLKNKNKKYYAEIEKILILLSRISNSKVIRQLHFILYKSIGRLISYYTIPGSEKIFLSSSTEQSGNHKRQLYQKYSEIESIFQSLSKSSKPLIEQKIFRNLHSCLLSLYEEYQETGQKNMLTFFNRFSFSLFLLLKRTKNNRNN